MAYQSKIGTRLVSNPTMTMGCSGCAATCEGWGANGCTTACAGNCTHSCNVICASQCANGVGMNAVGENF